MKQFLSYFWGVIVRPRSTFDLLASERSVRWGLAAASLGVFQVWGNMALHAAFGLDWLGTRSLLADPTFIAGFGHWRVNLVDYIPFLAAMMPLASLFGLVITSGIALLMSKMWDGQATFEQLVNTLAFATAVPTIVIGAASEWIFGVPIDLLTGRGYWWTAAMNGELGPRVGLAWNLCVFGVYLGANWVWQIALGTVAIRRASRLPAWAAALTMLVAFAASMYLSSVFIR
jgi:hypothetical protein